ncbi:unnamed protein product [Merluccius merluccius]
MSRWRRSLDELQVRRRHLGECERGQEALSRVTSCFQQLSSALGSTCDGSFLREELEESRVLAFKICSGLSRRLVALLAECDPSTPSPGERENAERVWVLFLSALENFLLDLHKASYLIGRFPLTQLCDRHSLVNAGSCDSMAGVAARAASVQTPWITVEVEPSPELTNHIAGLEILLQDMQLKVSVPFWSVESTQQAWAEAEDLMEDSMEDLMEVEVVSHDKTNTCCPSCCRLGCLLCLLN